MFGLDLEAMGKTAQELEQRVGGIETAINALLAFAKENAEALTRIETALHAQSVKS